MKVIITGNRVGRDKAQNTICSYKVGNEEMRSKTDRS